MININTHTAPSLQHLVCADVINFDAYESRAEAEEAIYRARQYDYVLGSTKNNNILCYNKGYNFRYEYSLHRDKSFNTFDDTYIRIDIFDCAALGGTAYLESYLGRTIIYTILLQDCNIILKYIHHIMSDHFFIDSLLREVGEDRYWIYHAIQCPFAQDKINELTTIIKNIVPYYKYAHDTTLDL